SNVSASRSSEKSGGRLPTKMFPLLFRTHMEVPPLAACLPIFPVNCGAETGCSTRWADIAPHCCNAVTAARPRTIDWAPPASQHPFDGEHGRREMISRVKPIPDGYPAVTPYLIVADGAGAIAFYERAFGAAVRLRLAQPDGRIGHAELEIGGSLIMLADEAPSMGALAPATVGG